MDGVPLATCNQVPLKISHSTKSPCGTKSGSLRILPNAAVQGMNHGKVGVSGSSPLGSLEGKA